MDALQLDLLFAVNQSAIDTTNQARLMQIADYLIENPSISIVLSGHADPSGKEELNENLAQQRAVVCRHICWTIMSLSRFLLVS